MLERAVGFEREAQDVGLRHARSDQQRQAADDEGLSDLGAGGLRPAFPVLVIQRIADAVRRLVVLARLGRGDWKSGAPRWSALN